jgi:hypothetical protein
MILSGEDGVRVGCRTLSQKNRDRPFAQPFTIRTFEDELMKLINAKPVPRTSVKATGKRGSKKRILAKP